MVQAEIFIGDTGTEFRFDIGVPVVDMILAKIKVVKPGDEPDALWTAQPIAGTQIVTYKTIAGDINKTGNWKMQVYVEFPGWKGYGTIVKLVVNKTI